MRSVLRRLRKRLRPQPIAIELDVVEQLILRYLLRFGAAPATDLRDEVLATRRTAAEQQVRLSLIRLESLRLIERDTSPVLAVEGGRVYRLTRDGKRLRKVIAGEPVSSIQTYL